MLNFDQPQYHTFQHLAFAAQILRPFGILPDSGIFGEFGNFGQPFLLAVEVKDTSVIQRCAKPNLAVGC
jgi:hypothetical protein